MSQIECLEPIPSGYTGVAKVPKSGDMVLLSGGDIIVWSDDKSFSPRVVLTKIPPKTRVEPFTKEGAIPHHGRLVVMHNGMLLPIDGFADDKIRIGGGWFRYCDICENIFHDDGQPVGRVIVEDQ